MSLYDKYKYNYDIYLFIMSKIYIEEQWYDITDFSKRHPGGNVIKSYADQDATLVYR